MPTPDTPTIHPGWISLAWNGVSILVPQDWTPHKISSCGFRTSGTQGPALEVKWQRMSEPFVPTEHLKILAKKYEDGGFLKTEPAALPTGWADTALEHAGRGVTALPYAWKSKKGARGAGAVLHNPKTGMAAVVQFLFRCAQDADTARHILAGFRDHTGEDAIPWAIFGVHASVPASFGLTSFSTRTDHFRLTFQQGKGKGATELTLDRLGPINELMGNRSQTQYADALYAVLGCPEGFFTQGDGFVQGQSYAPAGFFTRLLRRNSFRALRGRMWQPEGHPDLFGILMRGSTPEDLKAFDTVLANFRCP